jgi:NADPH2:quinone reductase
MQAIRVQHHGGAGVLVLREQPVPELEPGQALIKISVSGVNYLDVYFRNGQNPLPLPYTPGVEAVGVVAAIGRGVTEVNVGDRVAYALVQGSYAEYAAVPANKLVPVPSELEDSLAAAALLQGMTAHYLSHDAYAIRQGDAVLIHAGAGGVGLLLTQMARRRGARVLVTVSNEEKAQRAREAGADVTVNYAGADFEREVLSATGGRGVDVVYDSVGRQTFEKSLRCLKSRGMLVLCGASSGPVPPFDPMVLNARGSLYLTRPSLAHYIADRVTLLKRAGDVLRWVADGELRLHVGQIYPLADAARAHSLLESRATSGKLLLCP